MDTRRVSRLALALLALAGPAWAQTSEPTRIDEARQARETKAAHPQPFTPGRVERFLTGLETGTLFHGLLAGRDGFGLRIGGIENGAGLAAGPSWRTSSLIGGRLQAAASAAASISTDRDLAAVLSMPRAAAGRLALSADVHATHLAQERFFGRGMVSTRDDVTGFALDSRRVTGRATLAATRWLHVGGSAGTLRTSATDATAPGIPAIGTRFTGLDAAGLGAGTAFHVASVDATVDYRDMPQNPRSGGRYQVGIERYAGRALDRHSFTRINAELEQHLSAWKRQRVLTLRAIASASAADAGHEVPFYLQRTLGGSRVLRGFATDRFRDRQQLALQAEYGWDVTPFLNAVLFYETGAVAPAWRDLTRNSFQRDYGVGFRFGSARTVAFRTDVALGSGEGTRLTMRFNHAF